MTQRGSSSGARFDATWCVHAAGVALLAVATTCAYIGVVEPSHRSLAAQRERERQAAQDSADLQVIQDNTQALDRLARSLESKLTDTVELRPIDQLNRQLATVSELIEATGLKVAQMDPGEPAIYPRYTLVPIRVAGQGTFTDVLTFLHELQQNVKDTEVRAFAVHADPKAAPGGIAFELSLAWYAVQGTGVAQRPGTAEVPAARAGSAGRNERPVAGAEEKR